MFRTVLRPQHLKSISPRRSLVSSVLLTRTWENESVVDLRKEARNRGLSPKGNKSTLVIRIREHEERMTWEAISSHDPPVPAGAREASTVAASVTPGTPPDARPTVSLSKDFTNIYLPDVSQPDPEAPVQIPFLPDFWESSKKAEIASVPTSELPKIIVVGGSATHHGGGPSHNLHVDHEADAHLSPDTSSLTNNGGFWDDVANDLGVGAVLRTGNVGQLQSSLIDALPETSGSPSTEKTYSRPLDNDEARGVWVLLGLLTGSWIAGGIFSRKPVSSTEEELPAAAH